jgi:hypothetical protein
MAHSRPDGGPSVSGARALPVAAQQLPDRPRRQHRLGQKAARRSTTGCDLRAGRAHRTRRTEAEWAALRASSPDGQAVAASVLRARTRHVAAFQNAGASADACALEGAPGGGRQVVPAAADEQLCTLTRCPDDPTRYGVLTVRLPVRPDPRTRADWHPTLIRFRLSPTHSPGHCPARPHAAGARRAAAAGCRVHRRRPHDQPERAHPCGRLRLRVEHPAHWLHRAPDRWAAADRAPVTSRARPSRQPRSFAQDRSRADNPAHPGKPELIPDAHRSVSPRQ